MRTGDGSDARIIAAAFKGTDLRLRSIIDAHIETVLRLVDGNVSVAALLLGINRRSLQRRAAAHAAARRRRRRRGRA